MRLFRPTSLLALAMASAVCAMTPEIPPARLTVSLPPAPGRGPKPAGKQKRSSKPGRAAKRKARLQRAAGA